MPDSLAISRICLTVLHMSNTITVRLPEDLVRWLEAESQATGLPKGRIVREQLEQLRTKKVRQPFLDLAGSVEGAPDLSRRKGFGE
jgi:hypothetical protein